MDCEFCGRKLTYAYPTQYKSSTVSGYTCLPGKDEPESHSKIIYYCKDEELCKLLRSKNSTAIEELTEKRRKEEWDRLDKQAKEHRARLAKKQKNRRAPALTSVYLNKIVDQ